MTSLQPIADSLLVHASFVQRLARGLAGQDGDDLAQDTWVRALAAAPQDLRNQRGWLASLVANLGRNRRRAAARRRQREATVAGAIEPSVAEILAREEVRRHVVAAVVALPERLRRVVLLHFYEGLDSFAIGRQLDLPPSTVRTQLQQALAQLRGRLDAEHGDQRAAWALPLAGWFGSLPVGSLGTLLRVVWPLRAVLGAFALVLLAWLIVPLWLGGPAAPPMLPAGPIEVVAAKRENGPETVDRTTPRVAANELPATRARGPEDLWGRVVAAADGSPIAGAEVVLEHRDADEMSNLDLEYRKRVEVVGTVRSDTEGQFEFRVARALQHRLVVRAAGFATSRERQLTGGSECVVRLDRPAFVEGVVRRADGTPLGEVAVEALERGSNGAGETTRTAADGSFFLGGLGAKPTYVFVRAAGLLAPAWQLVELTPGQGQRLEFVVAAGRSAHGRVRDAETKEPIAGARIASSWTMDDAVTSAADGSYELRGLGERDSLYVQAEGYADEALPVTAQQNPVVLDIELRRGFEVTGRVVDPAGRAIPGAFVAAAADVMLSTMIGHTFWRTASVATDGRFRLRGLGRASTGGTTYWRPWYLLIRAPGHGTRVLVLSVPKTDRGDRDVGDVVLQVQGLLEGRVVDAEGHPMARAEIELRGVANGIAQLLQAGESAREPSHLFATRETFSAADGTFRFAGLGAGSYRLRAQLRGKSWDVESGPHEVAEGAIVAVPDLIADAGLVIEGTVQLGGRPGLPAGARITIYAFGAMSEQRYAQVAANGHFRIERLDPGNYLLSALDVPKGFAVLPQRDVAAGTKDVGLQLAVAETIEGRVVGPDDKPVRGVTVCFWPEGVNFAHYESADADGRFRLEVAPGAVGKVSAQDPDNIFRQVQQQNVLAGTRDLMLKLPN